MGSFFLSILILSTGVGWRADPLDGDPGRISRTDAFESVWKVLYRDAVGLVKAPLRWERENLLRFGFLVSGLALTYVGDEEVREVMRGGAGSGFRRVEPYIEPFGRNSSAQGLSLGIYLMGALAHDDDLKETGVTALESSFFVGAFVGMLKEAFGRRRPFEERGGGSFDPFGGSTSFPSLHAAHAFSLAAVVSSRYGPHMSMVLYPLAASIGITRLADDLHWSSDVLAGAVIGTLIGRYLARSQNENESPHFFLCEEVKTGFQGIAVRFPL